jgi:hypothetical protein
MKFPSPEERGKYTLFVYYESIKGEINRRLTLLFIMIK